MTTLLKKLLVFVLLGLGLLTSCSDNDNTTIPTTNETTIEDLLLEIDFQGYAVVTKNGTDLVRRGFGLANETTGLPNDFQLPYRIGSVTKTLTAAALVQLKRDGFINSFDQTLDEFDAEFPEGNQISIRNLLAHQSGIPEYQLIIEQAVENQQTITKFDIYDLITELISVEGLNFSPGSNKQYCNSNYLIAALLVEQLSGKPYEQYLQQFILNPLEMNSTFQGTDEIEPSSHAQGYLNGTPNSVYPMEIPFGAGNLSSSPNDMEKWINAVKTNWFSESEKAEIFAQDVPNGYVDFGLGWFTSKEPNATMYWHGGDINGYWSMIGFIPENDLTIVLLSNQQDNSGIQRNTFVEFVLKNDFN